MRAEPAPELLGGLEAGAPDLGPGGLDPRHRGQAQAAQHVRSRRAQRRCGIRGPRQEPRRARVADDPPRGHRDHAIGGGQAALEAVLGEQDRDVEVLVAPAQKAHQLVAGDRVELRGRLVEHEQRRPSRERGAQRDPLKLPSRQRRGRAVEQVRDPQRERRLLDAAGDGTAGLSAILERERQLGSHRSHHNLGFRVLEQRPDLCSQLAGTMLSRVESRDVHRARERAAVKVRDEPAGGTQHRRLARP